MPRRLAFDVLQRINEGAYSHIALASALDKATLNRTDRGLATQLVYGVLTWQRALDDLIHPRLKSGIKSVGMDGRILLRLGVYQLLFLSRIPAHAAINETVELSHTLTPEITPVINAVLRRISRELPSWWIEEDRQKKPARYLGQRWSVPNWIANRLIQQLGGVDRAEPWLEAMSTAPPLWLRAQASIVVPDAEAHGTVPGAWRAATMTPEILEGVRNGSWAVQDLAAQLVGHLAAQSEGASVLDACAGLGGKSLHLASLGKTVTAVEPNVSKVNLLKEAAGAQGLKVEVQVGRAEEATGEYDVVLVDAPCTGLGTMRRHPETRWTKNEADVVALAEIQARILDGVVDRVRPGGTLVYSVCTWTREETSKQVESFLARHPDFELVMPESEVFDWAPFLKGSYVLLSAASHDADGFFAARLVRRR